MSSGGASASDGFEERYDVLYKIVLIGDSGVGKSNFMSRYTQDKIDLYAKSTIGLEFATRSIEQPDGTVIKLQIWDTAGQERFKSITSAYYRNAVGALLLYDITRSDSLQHAEKRWLRELQDHASPDIVVGLIGHKSDLEQRNMRQVQRSEGEQVMHRNGDHVHMFMESSAFDNVNVREAFEQLAQMIHRRTTNNGAEEVDQQQQHENNSGGDKKKKKTKNNSNNSNNSGNAYGDALRLDQQTNTQAQQKKKPLC